MITSRILVSCRREYFKTSNLLHSLSIYKYLDIFHPKKMRLKYINGFCLFFFFFRVCYSLIRKRKIQSVLCLFLLAFEIIFLCIFLPSSVLYGFIFQNIIFMPIFRVNNHMVIYNRSYFMLPIQMHHIRRDFLFYANSPLKSYNHFELSFTNFRDSKRAQ